MRIPAASGPEGLAFFRLDPTDLVVTDLIMPDQEGLETIRQLRELRPGVKILAMSGGGQALDAPSILDLASSLGATGTLEKPFGQDELVAALERLAVA